MPFINGYKFTTESKAQKAVKACNAYYEIPKTPEDITQNWVEYQKANLNKPIFWYITYDESLKAVLGEPIEFEVITPNPFNTK
jgi:hypothetical protein